MNRKLIPILLAALLSLSMAFSVSGTGYAEDPAGFAGVSGELKSGEEEGKKSQEDNDAEEQARKEAEEKARKESEEQARKEAEEKASREESEAASREAASKEESEKASREESEKASREESEKASREESEKASREESERASREESERASREAETEEPTSSQEYNETSATDSGEMTDPAETPEETYAPETTEETGGETFAPETTDEEGGETSSDSEITDSEITDSEATDPETTEPGTEEPVSPEESETTSDAESSEETTGVESSGEETSGEETSRPEEETAPTEPTPPGPSIPEFFTTVVETTKKVPETTIGPTVVDTIIEPVFTKDFRFRKITADPAILAGGARVYTKKDYDSSVIGVAAGDVPVYIIQKGQDWTYIESGYVRGFVSTLNLETGDAAEELMQQQEAWEKTHSQDDEKKPPYGIIKERINHLDNPSFDYTLTTTMEVSAEIIYSVAAEEANIYDYAGAADKNRATGSKAKVVGTADEGDLLYILDWYDDEVAFVESGNVRGFINREHLILGSRAKAMVEQIGEKKMPKAEQQMKPEDNRALYYTVTSILEPGDAVRQELVNFALQFVGNPYKWGGESLTHGTDCSGFVMTVYSHFGYSLPRTSVYQREYGQSIESLAEAKLGDIICYNGHVALYIGNGQIVHASNSRRYPAGGIKVSEVSVKPIISIRRVIQ